jgi:hypothetical protein
MEFKIGDKVIEIVEGLELFKAKGIGTVIQIDRIGPFPIVVKFNNGEIDYMVDGKRYLSLNATRIRLLTPLELAML